MKARNRPGSASTATFINKSQRNKLDRPSTAESVATTTKEDSNNADEIHHAQKHISELLESIEFSSSQDKESITKIQLDTKALLGNYKVNATGMEKELASLIDNFDKERSNAELMESLLEAEKERMSFLMGVVSNMKSSLDKIFRDLRFGDLVENDDQEGVRRNILRHLDSAMNSVRSITRVVGAESLSVGNEIELIRLESQSNVLAPGYFTALLHSKRDDTSTEGFGEETHADLDSEEEISMKGGLIRTPSFKVESKYRTRGPVRISPVTNHCIPSCKNIATQTFPSVGSSSKPQQSKRKHVASVHIQPEPLSTIEASFAIDPTLKEAKQKLEVILSSAKSTKATDGTTDMRAVALQSPKLQIESLFGSPPKKDRFSRENSSPIRQNSSLIRQSSMGTTPTEHPSSSVVSPTGQALRRDASLRLFSSPLASSAASAQTNRLKHNPILDRYRRSSSQMSESFVVGGSEKAQ